MVLLVASATSSVASAASTLGLKGSRHFVAIDGAGECKRKRAASLHLDGKGNVVVLNAAGQRRRTSWSLESAAQLRAVLLKPQGSLFIAAAALPRDLPTASHTGWLGVR